MLGSQVSVADDVDTGFNVKVIPTVLVRPPPVIVIVALFVPTVAVAVFTLTVRPLLLDPDVGLSVSQLAFSLTVQDVFEATARV